MKVIETYLWPEFTLLDQTTNGVSAICKLVQRFGNELNVSILTEEVTLIDSEHNVLGEDDVSPTYLECFCYSRKRQCQLLL